MNASEFQKNIVEEFGYDVTPLAFDISMNMPKVLYYFFMYFFLREINIKAL